MVIVSKLRTSSPTPHFTNQMPTPLSRLRPWLRWIRDVADLASDRQTLSSFIRLRVAGDGARPLRLRPLDGQTIWARPGTADLWAIETLKRPPFHLPPAELDPREISMIWDLGANIGLTMSHLALACPLAKVIGVELDADNAALCRANVAPWGERCELIEGAVWTADGSVSYGRERGDELSFHVGADRSPGSRAVSAISLNRLLERHPSELSIDYVKMDIEGAEREVLRENTEWAQRVRSIKVEVHPPYTVDECRQDLGQLGFRTEVEPTWDGDGMPPIVGIRQPD